jgi:hypothetical protein
MIRNFRRFTAVWFFLPLCASSPVKITAKPNQIWIERGPCGQYLNFDFVVENTTGETLNISLVEVSVTGRKIQNRRDECRRLVWLWSRRARTGRWQGRKCRERLSRRFWWHDAETRKRSKGPDAYCRKSGHDGVKQGEVIAAVGVSGSVEEPHLHYELRTGPGAQHGRIAFVFHAVLPSARFA